MTFGYRGGLYNHKEKLSGDLMQCHYARCTREPLDFRSECVLTAKLVAAQARKLGRTPVLMLSGGLDSEVMVLAFIEAGVEFEAITFRYSSRRNLHEIVYVNKFLKRNQIKHTFFEIDPQVWFISREANRLYDDVNLTTAASLPVMKVMSHIWENGGCPVIGNGDLYLEKTAHGWEYTELEYMLSWYRHAIDNGILGSIGFFQHTPEIVLAAVRHPDFQRLGQGLNVSANQVLQNSRSVKYKMYRSFWPELEDRFKFHGAELIGWLVDQVDLRPAPEVVFDDKVQIPFKEFERMLQVTINPVPHS